MASFTFTVAVCVTLTITVTAYACLSVLPFLLPLLFMLLPVPVEKKSYSASLGHATQQQKLQSSPRFGVFKADFPTCLRIRRSVVFTDTGKRPEDGL